MLERINQIMVRPAIDIKAGVAGSPELLQVLPPLVLQVDAAPEDHLPNLITDLHCAASLGRSYGPTRDRPQIARGLSHRQHAIVLGASPLRCFTAPVIKSDASPWRLFRICTNSATPKRVNPPSRGCAGKIDPSKVLHVRGVRSMSGFFPIPQIAWYTTN